MFKLQGTHRFPPAKPNREWHGQEQELLAQLVSILLPGAGKNNRKRVVLVLNTGILVLLAQKIQGSQAGSPGPMDLDLACSSPLRLARLDVSVHARSTLLQPLCAALNTQTPS